MKERVPEHNSQLGHSGVSEGIHQKEPKTEPARPFLQAAEYIITSKTIKGSWWFSRTPRLSKEIQELNKLVDALLSTYKGYFDDLIKREAWSESQCLFDFQKISEEVLDDDVENYNWTRIAMLLALACRMAQHRFSNGSTIEFVTLFSQAVGSCIERRVNSWTQREDRWKSLLNDKSSPQPISFKNVIGAGTVIVSAIVTVMNLTKSSSALSSLLKS